MGENLGGVLVPHQLVADRRAIHRGDHHVQITNDRVFVDAGPGTPDGLR